MVKVNKKPLDVSFFVLHSYLLLENEPTHLLRREWRRRMQVSSIEGCFDRTVVSIDQSRFDRTIFHNDFTPIARVKVINS